MNELLKMVPAQFPKYISIFVSLVSTPKQFVRKKNKYSERSLTEAVTFLTISFGLDLILRTPLIPENANFGQYTGIQALLALMELLLFTAALTLSWKLVGGHSPFGRFLITLCYFYAVLIILLRVSSLFAYGLVKYLDSELYKLMVNVSKTQGMGNSELSAYMDHAVKAFMSGERRKLLAFFAFGVTILAGSLGATIWTYAGWGAYRELTGLSKSRSFLAGIIFVLLGAVAVGFLYFVNLALA